jgi:hypothetical protein
MKQTRNLWRTVTIRLHELLEPAEEPGRAVLIYAFGAANNSSRQERVSALTLPCQCPSFAA